MAWYSKNEIREIEEKAMRWGQTFGNLWGLSHFAGLSLTEEGKMKILEEVLASCHGNYEFQAGTSFPCMLWCRIRNSDDTSITEWAEDQLRMYNENLMNIGKYLKKEAIRLVDIERFPNHRRKFSYKDDAGRHYKEVLECIDILDLKTGERKIRPQ